MKAKGLQPCDSIQAAAAHALKIALPHLSQLHTVHELLLTGSGGFGAELEVMCAFADHAEARACG